MMMPQALIAQALPLLTSTFSAQVALGRLDEMRSSLASTLRACFVVIHAIIHWTDPAALNQSSVCYISGGRFGDRSTSWLPGLCASGIAAGLVGHLRGVEFISRAFYAFT
jgi:hypothetical protein